jgi:hypothetical protein
MYGDALDTAVVGRGVTRIRFLNLGVLSAVTAKERDSGLAGCFGGPQTAATPAEPATWECAPAGWTVSFVARGAVVPKLAAYATVFK